MHVAKQHAFNRHACLRKNLGVHDHDIRHGHKRGQTGQQFAANSCVILG
jgi:hypothetical protein